MWQWIYDTVFGCWMLFGIKVLRYRYVDVYTPNDDTVVGITFSTHEYYIDEVGKIEVV